MTENQSENVVGVQYAIENEIDLRSVFRKLWSRRFLIGGATIVVTLIVGVLVLTSPNIYRAEALFAPNQDSAAGGLSALASQYGGLASLAGIDLGRRTAGKTDMGLEILKSRKFISEFVSRRNILVPLMAASGWDPKTGELIIDSSVYDEAASEWIRNVRAPKDTMPSYLEAYEKFSEDVLNVSRNRKTSFVTVSVEHHSPIVAKQWVDWLIEDLNEAVMRQEVIEAEQAIDFLRKQMESTPLAEFQIVFSRLIEEQMKTVLLSKVTKEYLLKTIDPAVVPEVHARPMRLQMIVITALITAAMAILLVLVLDVRRDDP